MEIWEGSTLSCAGYISVIVVRMLRVWCAQASMVLQVCSRRRIEWARISVMSINQRNDVSSSGPHFLKPVYHATLTQSRLLRRSNGRYAKLTQPYAQLRAVPPALYVDTVAGVPPVHLVCKWHHVWPQVLLRSVVRTGGSHLHFMP